MIYDKLSRAGQYAAVHPRVAKALKYLTETDFSKLEDGRYELEGKDLFVMLSTSMTREENLEPEAHKAYLDIQYVISGREKIGVAPLEAMTEETRADPDGDIWFYHGPVDELLLEGDRFVILWPGDAHAPCVAVDKPEQERKCVVKVKI